MDWVEPPGEPVTTGDLVDGVEGVIVDVVVAWVVVVTTAP